MLNAKIDFNLDNAAFEDMGEVQIKEICLQIEKKLNTMLEAQQGERDYGYLIDINGNRVGRVQLIRE